MIILAIDTSCDDTAISIIKVKSQKSKVKSFIIVSNVVSSQVKIHRNYGGVYPSLAKREHQRNLVPVLEKALKEAKLLKISNSLPLKAGFNEFSNSNFQTLKKILEREPELFNSLVNFLQHHKKPKVDAIAITVGPGLEPCLWVGVNFAKALGYFWEKPLIPVNHIEAHIAANFIGRNPKHQIPNPKSPLLAGSRQNAGQIPSTKSKNSKQIDFPAVCLVISGGHTQLILMRKIGDYKIIGETRDDAAGECFDKTARILGLSYPGGPSIAAEAAIESKVKNSKLKIKLPRPMMNSKDYDFSFSGLKTAVLYQYQSQKSKVKSQKYKQEMAREIQQAIVDVLIKKTIKAAKNFKTKSIILSGGVAANQQLREQFQKIIKKKRLGFKFYVPSSKLCTDNAVMVGIAGYFNRKKAIKNWRKIEANANLRL